LGSIFKSITHDVFPIGAAWIQIVRPDCGLSQ